VLHRGHIAAIPFENLDIVLGGGVSVDLPSVQAKLVGRRRGGYCYEHGVLFAAVLERLGYTVERLLARVGANNQRPRPRSHMTLRVQADGEQWLADAGFGAGLLEPLPWGDTGPHQQGGWTYQLVPDGNRAWLLRERGRADWAPLYSFTAKTQHAADVEVANHFTSTHPSSPFTGRLIVMRKIAHPGERHRQRGGAQSFGRGHHRLHHARRGRAAVGLHPGSQVRAGAARVGRRSLPVLAGEDAASQGHGRQQPDTVVGAAGASSASIRRSSREYSAWTATMPGPPAWAAAVARCHPV